MEKRLDYEVALGYLEVVEEQLEIGKNLGDKENNKRKAEQLGKVKEIQEIIRELGIVY